ncbi:kinesin, putative [Bodo saltans]|uniref:Kinesin-like protein n=1 Tax=Bodo saltans TaxID=75058 RepID=A0A0S4JL77_BODSA|nr:kinesin, putative [Bodo saltans]|eukprot:CUG90927.1 kinesin, putative [Bodo saltans]
MAELIEMGNLARSVASTKMNERSSRSHTIFKVTLSQVTTSIPRKQFEKPTQHLRSAQINLVDLAGSERNKKTGATGDRLKEAASINRSLMCLKQVIDALVDNSQIVKAANKKRVPYRDSHLTSVLQDSLGGNAKTWMLVCVSPHSDNLEESQNTLRYGSRARKILNQVHVNENASARLMLDLEDELDRLKAELASSAEATTPGAVDSLKAQIEAHESAINSLEGEVEAQKQKIERLQVERDKGTKEREASAMKHLTTVMQARLQRDSVEQTLQARTDEIVALREHLIKLQTERHTSVTETEKSDSEAKKLRAAALQLDQTIDEMKRKIGKLESQRRSLQVSCDEGEQFVKSLAQDKVATILRARLQVARIRIDHRRKLEELKLQSSKKHHDLKELSHRQERVDDDHVHAELSTLHQTINSLRHQLASTRSEEEKVHTEKTNQIATLQQELGHLQQEVRRKRESHQAKLTVITNDWDKRMQTLSQETEKQLQAHHEEWETRRRELEDLRDQQKSDIIADYERRTAQVQERSDERLRDVAERGEAEIINMQGEWQHALADKRRDNDSLRESLRQLSQDNQKYCALQYRISTAMELLQKAKFSRKLSAEAKEMITLALEFHALFEEYHPEKTKLDHLIKANLTLQRCSVMPILGEGIEGMMTRAKSPAARSQSPVVGAGRSGVAGRSASRANSPSLGRRTNSTAGGGLGIEDSPHSASHAPPPRVGSLRSVSPRAGSVGSSASPTTRRL